MCRVAGNTVTSRSSEVGCHEQLYHLTFNLTVETCLQGPKHRSARDPRLIDLIDEGSWDCEHCRRDDFDESISSKLKNKRYNNKIYHRIIQTTSMNITKPVYI